MIDTVQDTLQLDKLIRSLRDPDPEHQVRAGNALGELARRGKAHEIAGAGGVRALIDCFSRGGPEAKNSTAHALRDCAEAGEVQRVIHEGGFPILHGMVKYGKWDVSSLVIESLSGMSHPEAIILIQEIVNRKASALERDTFRDVYEMIREPFPDSAIRRNDLDLNEHEAGTRMGSDLRKEVGGQGAKGSSGPGSPRDTLKLVFFPFFFLGSVIKHSLSGKEKKSVPEAHVPSREEIPRLLGKLDHADELDVQDRNDVLDRLLWFVRRGWGDLIIQGDGIEKSLPVMDVPVGDGIENSLSAMDVPVGDGKRKVETLIIELIQDLDDLDVKGTTIVEQLCTGLYSPVPHVRSFTLGMLRKLSRRTRQLDEVKKQGIRDILKMLDDEDPDIRLQTIGFLGELGSSRAIKPLREVIGNEENKQVRRAAQMALERLS